MPLDLGPRAECHIGGNISSNAGAALLPSCPWITTWRSQSCLAPSLRVPSAGCSCPAALAEMQKDQQHLQSREKVLGAPATQRQALQGPGLLLASLPWGRQAWSPQFQPGCGARSPLCPAGNACLGSAAHGAGQGRCQHVVPTLPLLRCMRLASGMALCTARSREVFFLLDACLLTTPDALQAAIHPTPPPLIGSGQAQSATTQPAIPVCRWRLHPGHVYMIKQACGLTTPGPFAG